MTVEVTDYQVKILSRITHICIYDDESFEMALAILFQMHKNQGTNIKYLQGKCKENGINTLIS